VRDALDPAVALEAVDQGGDGARREREAVAQLTRGQLVGRVEVVHRLELDRARVQPPGHDRVEAVVLQTEAAQRRKKFRNVGQGPQHLSHKDS